MIFSGRGAFDIEVIWIHGITMCTNALAGRAT